MLRDCVGIYRCCPEIGLRAHSESVVWKIFQQGWPVNLAESFNHKRGLNTLQEPVAVKAVIPLRGIDIPDPSGRTVGVLVVDAEDPPRPIALTNQRPWAVAVKVGAL